MQKQKQKAVQMQKQKQGNKQTIVLKQTGINNTSEYVPLPIEDINIAYAVSLKQIN